MVTEVLLSTKQRAEWNTHLPAGRSVFGSHGFATLSERFRGVAARLHVIADAEGTITHPMLLRPLAHLPFRAAPGAQCDVVTPEFTGPLEQGTSTGLRACFQTLRAQRMQTEGVVAEFAHLYPWANAERLLGSGVVPDREIVWVDVTQTPETLFTESFAHACRKNIHKAEREGVETYSSDSDDDLASFFAIYSGTMQRNNALSRYAFSLQYFIALRDLLPDNTRFVFARHNGTVIAATVYLFDDTDVYSYLGGADAAAQHLRPTNLVVWNTIRWAHARGKRRLVLGGGYRPDDGIFRFKATFSPLRQQFSTYRKVHNTQQYEALAALARAHYGRTTDHGNSYFPIYRDTTGA